jgi:hypothetical protein
VKRQFSGFEIAGIKLHAAIDVLIKNNRIHDTFRGLWLDWQAQGARVTGNLFYRNSSEDLFIEICHGPHVVDNNIFLSETSLRNFAQGGAFIHNLFAGKMLHEPILNRFTPYHFPHSTQVAGLMTILGGDDRFLNNIFVGNESSETSKEKYGLTIYDDYPVETDNWLVGKNVDEYAKIKLPLYISSNLYLNGAKPYMKETDSKVNNTLKPEISIEEKGNAAFLQITTDESFNLVNCKTVNTQNLGFAFQPESPFENPDGSPLKFTSDYFEMERSESNPTVGPFKALKAGKNVFKIWDKN